MCTAQVPTEIPFNVSISTAWKGALRTCGCQISSVVAYLSVPVEDYLASVLCLVPCVTWYVRVSDFVCVCLLAMYDVFHPLPTP